MTEPVEVVELAEAYLGSRCLHVAVELGLADAPDGAASLTASANFVR